MRELAGRSGGRRIRVGWKAWFSMDSGNRLREGFERTWVREWGKREATREWVEKNKGESDE